jgi:pimeloyl-ACP methyl ester carboxylesterase
MQSLSKWMGNGWDAVRKTSQIGASVGRAVQAEISHLLDKPDSAVISGRKPESSSATLRLTQGILEQSGLDRKAVQEALASTSFSSSQELRSSVQDLLGGREATESLAASRPNFFPSLLAAGRSHPPLKMKGRLQFDFTSVPVKNIHFHERDGRVVAQVNSSLNQLLGEGDTTRRIAEDYASDDVTLKLTIPVGSGKPADYRALPAEAKKELLKKGLQAAPSLTVMLHGFQSNKEIWDSTADQWTDSQSVGIALDGFGGNGMARSDASSPYTPKQYAFQMLESLDALGLLGGKPLQVVGHSMGGAATAEMAVALDKAQYPGEANFVLMAPACSPDHMPIFQSHRDLVDVVNAVFIGGMYVPLGAWNVTAPLIQWTDEKFPLLSKLVVDYGLGLRDAPEHIRNHNASYYRTPDAQNNRVRRDRSMEAMMGMAAQKGVDPRELRRAGKRFGIFAVNFGQDRLVDPTSVARLRGKGVGYLEIPSGSHNACFDPGQAERIQQASQRYFESHPRS